MNLAVHDLPFLTSKARRIFLLMVLIGLYLGLAVATLRTRPPQDDEAGFANPSYNLLHNGFMGTTIYDYYGAIPAESLKRHTYWSPPVFFLTNVVLFKVCGFGLTQIRIESIALGGIALAAWYILMRCGGNSPALSLLVTGFISLDYFFQISAASGRMDMMCLALGIAGLATYCALRESHLTLALLTANSLVAASGLTHPVGVAYFCGLAFLVVSRDWKNLRWNHLALSVVPYFIGAVGWGAYILEDPAGFRDQLYGQVIATRISSGMPLEFSPWMALKAELLRRYVEPFGLAPGVPLLNRAKAVVLAAYLIGVVGILITRRLRSDWFLRTLIVLAGIDFFVLTFVATSKNSYYLPHITMVLASCLGLFLLRLPAPGSRGQLLAVATLAGLAAIQSAGLLIHARENAYKNIFMPAVEAIRENSEPGSLVFGSAHFWFALEPDRTLVHDATFGDTTGLRAKLIVIDPLFKGFLEQARLQHSAHSKHMNETIANSRKVFDNGVYAIYQPRIGDP